MNKLLVVVPYKLWIFAVTTLLQVYQACKYYSCSGKYIIVLFSWNCSGKVGAYAHKVCTCTMCVCVRACWCAWVSLCECAQCACMGATCLAQWHTSWTPNPRTIWEGQGNAVNYCCCQCVYQWLVPYTVYVVALSPLAPPRCFSVQH